MYKLIRTEFTGHAFLRKDVGKFNDLGFALHITRLLNEEELLNRSPVSWRVAPDNEPEENIE